MSKMLHSFSRPGGEFSMFETALAFSHFFLFLLLLHYIVLGGSNLFNS